VYIDLGENTIPDSVKTEWALDGIFKEGNKEKYEYIRDYCSFKIL